MEVQQEKAVYRALRYDSEPKAVYKPKYSRVISKEGEGDEKPLTVR